MNPSPPHTTFFAELTPVFEESMLIRYLGYPRGEQPDQRVARALAEQRKCAAKLLQPRGVYGLFSGEVCFAPGFPLYQREVYLCVVTIGDGLEKRAAEFAAAGNVLDSFVLDTLGSVYAEGVAAAAYRQLGESAEKDRLLTGCRISPGYGTWSLAYQREIMDLLPVGEIGIRLSPGLMMIPRKSVSFAAERSRQPLRLREGEQCEHCEVDNCRYRRHPRHSS
jgi:hypothetical protein